MIAWFGVVVGATTATYCSSSCDSRAHYVQCCCHRYADDRRPTFNEVQVRVSVGVFPRLVCAQLCIEQPARARISPMRKLQGVREKLLVALNAPDNSPVAAICQWLASCLVKRRLLFQGLPRASKLHATHFMMAAA